MSHKLSWRNKEMYCGFKSIVEKPQFPAVITVNRSSLTNVAQTVKSSAFLMFSAISNAPFAFSIKFCTATCELSEVKA